MKHIIRLLLFVISLTAFSGAASAQNRKQRLTREQLAEVQAKHIAKELAMDDKMVETFIYKESKPRHSGICFLAVWKPVSLL